MNTVNEAPEILRWDLNPSREVTPAYIIPNAFSIAEINYLHKLINVEDVEEGNATGDPSRRNNVGIVWLKNELKFHWAYEKCAGLVKKANHENFNKRLSFMETLQYTLYNDVSESYYGQHFDQLVRTNRDTKRVLSFSIQLSSPEVYEGGELEIYTANDFSATKNIGDMIIFESTLLHEVKQVTAGTRVSLVGWVHGPNI
jgi:PKHD-type hydroxylase